MYLACFDQLSTDLGSMDIPVWRPVLCTPLTELELQEGLRKVLRPSGASKVSESDSLTVLWHELQHELLSGGRLRTGAYLMHTLITF